MSRLIQRAKQHGFNDFMDWEEVSEAEVNDDDLDDRPEIKMMEEDKGDGDEAYEFSPST